MKFKQSKLAGRFATLGTTALVAASLALTPALASAAGKKKAPPRPTKEAAKAEPKKEEAKPAEAKPAEAPPTTTAAAIPAEPTDELILSGDNVVAVQPVFMVGAGAEAGWYDMAAYVSGAKVDKAASAEAAKAAIAAPKAIDKGFGFAGASSAKDVRVLHQAIALGFVPSLVIAGQAEKAKSLATGLVSSMDALSDLTPETQESAKLFAALGLADKKVKEELVGMIFARAMRAGMKGIADGPQRAHGYYVAGVWTGMSLLFASLGGKSETFADLAEPICVLLDKDAAFGGADRTIASHMRTIAAELKKERPAAATIRGEVEAILNVKPD
ncbi:MAG: hypothetical protein H6747_03600 [Deltaproteobacteria bacterium]|nr:hypothetical protein [Deltaproteobacteria bacterium]